MRIEVASLAWGWLAGVAAAACPPGMAVVADFCVDRFEAPNQAGVRPFVARDALEGERWCAAQGRRLCSQAEWERACAGPRGLAYPYGDTYRPGVCNDQKTWRPVDWRLVQKYPAPAGRAHVDWLNQSDPSGSHPGCVSEEGVYDLAGNASEWVLKTGATGGPYSYGMMGCYWSGCYRFQDPLGVKPGCRGTLNAGHPGDAHLFRTYEAGYRCCSDMAFSASE